ncbi:Kinesin-like protein KIF3B [Exaiptasia diaphana]|nr:Kinesin-like protein KIF3B [Exaiptasia diaphana]
MNRHIIIMAIVISGTIFAYGQTGTGKTFTMEGVKSDPNLKGVIPNSFEHIFTHIARTTNEQYLVRASYLEIYQEEIKDLLAKDLKRRLELKERPDTGVYVKDLQSFVCKSVKEIEHSGFRMSGKRTLNSVGEAHIRVGKLNMVDLAGSERQAKTGAEGPASYNYEESITTLRYANRAKNIKNKPHINEDPKDALLREFQEEIARLKGELDRRGGKKKKRRRKGPDGVEIEEDDDDDDTPDQGQVEDYMKAEQAKLDQEKKALLENHSMVAEEKQRLMAIVQQKEKEMKKQREAQASLTAKIKMMESKLLIGGKSIIDKTSEQERALEQRRQEIAEQKRREREMQQKLESKDEDTIEVKETYSSLHQEVEMKTKKLKKLFMKLQAIKSEILDQQEVHISERQELEQAQEELTRELKLKAAIVESFIPPEEKTKLMNRAYYDEENEVWKLKPVTENNKYAII